MRLNNGIMKVIILNGSPKAHGNTATALHEVERTLQQQGIETEWIHVGHLQKKHILSNKTNYSALPPNSLYDTFSGFHLSFGVGCSAGWPMAMTHRGTMVSGNFNTLETSVTRSSIG